jgi:hypothetical protein
MTYTQSTRSAPLANYYLQALSRTPVPPLQSSSAYAPLGHPFATNSQFPLPADNSSVIRRRSFVPITLPPRSIRSSQGLIANPPPYLHLLASFEASTLSTINRFLDRCGKIIDSEGVMSEGRLQQLCWGHLPSRLCFWCAIRYLQAASASFVRLANVPSPSAFNQGKLKHHCPGL